MTTILTTLMGQATGLYLNFPIPRRRLRLKTPSTTRNFQYLWWPSLLILTQRCHTWTRTVKITLRSEHHSWVASMSKVSKISSKDPCRGRNWRKLSVTLIWIKFISFRATVNSKRLNTVSQACISMSRIPIVTAVVSSRVKTLLQGS